MSVDGWALRSTWVDHPATPALVSSA